MEEEQETSDEDGGIVKRPTAGSGDE